MGMPKKTKGETIEGDSAVERLCYLRTVLEKIRPIEHKLKYQVDKFVNIAGTGEARADDPLRFKANPSLLANKLDDDEDEFEDDAEKRKKKTSLSHSMMRELKSQMWDTPEEISHQADTRKQKYITAQKEKERYEEDNFMRLPVSKAERM